ncbi:MAG TPA: hypothetical protein V6C81_14785 [Planktothrix sp.]|jgi:hypothetical protein
MTKMNRNEITALMALIGITGGMTSAQLSAAASDLQNSNPLYVAEKTAPAGKGKDSACGKGSCGVDKKGAAAATKAHAGKSKGKSASQTTKSGNVNAAASDKSPSTK